jgi:S-ribosylhomocysteine lyase
MFEWIEKYEGEVPGATPGECGNWRDQNLDMAKWECNRYADLLKNPAKRNLEYPK